MDAWDFPGNTITSQRANDYMECQRQCQAEPKCVLSVWSQPWNHVEPNQCFLKSSFVLSDKRHYYGTFATPKYCLER